MPLIQDGCTECGKWVDLNQPHFILNYRICNWYGTTISSNNSLFCSKECAEKTTERLEDGPPSEYPNG